MEGCGLLLIFIRYTLLEELRNGPANGQDLGSFFIRRFSHSIYTFNLSLSPLS